MAKKRITELATETTLKDGQYVAIDHATDGTKKYNIGAELTDLKEDLEAETTARENADTKMASEISDLFEMATPSAYNTDKVPYLFRPSGGGKYIGGIEKDTIVGGTVAWNQLVVIPATATKNGVTFTNNNDGSVTIDGTASSTVYHRFETTAPSIANHVYYLDKGADGSFSLYNDSGGLDTGEGLTGRSVVGKATADKYFYYWVGSGTTINNIKAFPQIIDLTTYFGSSTIADYVYTLEQGTAGAGVAWLKKNAPQLFKYNAYDAGSLASVSGLTSHDMVGFNQWDEEWEVGTISLQTGETASDPSRIRSKNFIPCIPSTAYCFTKLNVTDLTDLKPFFYDADKNFILVGAWSNGSKVQNTPSNCHFMKFICAAGYGTTYKNDICINLHWDGERDGEYEPYVKHSYPLDSDLTLRGIPKLDSANNLYYDGDTYESDGTVTRKYGTRAYQSGDESLTDAITDGTTTVYKLSTPTTETADPYQNPQIVDKYGTEEYVTTGIVPVGHDTEYYLDADSVLTPPSTAGTYSLKVTVASDGSKSYSWVSD